MDLDGSLTIKDLVKMGITQVGLIKPQDHTDLPNNWWINIEKTKKRV